MKTTTSSGRSTWVQCQDGSALARRVLAQETRSAVPLRRVAARTRARRRARFVIRLANRPRQTEPGQHGVAGEAPL